MRWNNGCNRFVILRLTLVKKEQIYCGYLYDYYRTVIFNTEVLQKCRLCNLELIHKPEFHIMVVSGIAPRQFKIINSCSPGED